MLFLIGRYVMHAYVVNALNLEPPVPSIFEGAEDERADLDHRSRKSSRRSACPKRSRRWKKASRWKRRAPRATWPRPHQIWGGHHTLHAIGAVVEGANIVGTKTWAHTAGGATPLVTLWNSDTGKLEAIIEAFALGQMRTGGISGVATARMAADGCRRARHHRHRQAGADPGRRGRRRAKLEAHPRFQPDAGEPPRLYAASWRNCFPQSRSSKPVRSKRRSRTRRSSLLITRARTDRHCGAHAARKARISNAVGAITPEREEFTQDVFDRASS